MMFSLFFPPLSSPGAANEAHLAGPNDFGLGASALDRGQKAEMPS